MRLAVTANDGTVSAVSTPDEWRKSACILCESNCGIEIRLGEDGRTFDRIRGDRDHPASRGYTCEKPLGLDGHLALLQMVKQLRKLPDVKAVMLMPPESTVARELMLVKVKATGAQRAEIKRTTDIFRGQIVDVTSSVYTIQLAGTSDKLDSFIQAIGTAAILETVRSGVTGIARGDKVLSI